MSVMRFFTVLYHAWPTLHGRLASGLFTQSPGFITPWYTSYYHVIYVLHGTNNLMQVPTGRPAHYPSYPKELALHLLGFVVGGSAFRLSGLLAPPGRRA